jgi:hypothetical protein
MKKYRMFAVLKGCLFVVLMSIVLGFVVKGLWNALIPEIMGGPQITYWQALGLFVLSKILFGGFHRHGGHGGGDRGRWKERMRERWTHMSDEDREKFRAGMGRGRGGWCDRRPVDAQKVAEPQV